MLSPVVRQITLLPAPPRPLLLTRYRTILVAVPTPLSLPAPRAGTATNLLLSGIGVILLLPVGTETTPQFPLAVDLTRYELPLEKLQLLLRNRLYVVDRPLAVIDPGV